MILKFVPTANLELALVKGGLHSAESGVGKGGSSRWRQTATASSRTRSASTITSARTERADWRVGTQNLGAEFGIGSSVVEERAVGVGNDFSGDATQSFVHGVDLVTLLRDVVTCHGQRAHFLSTLAESTLESVASALETGQLSVLLFAVSSQLLVQSVQLSHSKTCNKYL